MISFTDISLSYADKQVLKAVSLTVPKGQMQGIAGASGCGKSTLLKCLIGLEKNWTGSLEFDGVVTAAGKRPRDFYRKVQMVFQDPYESLHPRHTVDAALKEVTAIHRLDRADARIDKVLDQVALPRSVRARYPHELSGGQRQRVAIARALLVDPAILLLDEPTSALDLSVQAEILNLIAEVRLDRQLTCLLVSHDFGVLGYMCDEIAVMADGRIVERVDHETLAARAVISPVSRQLLDASDGYVRRETTQ